MPPSGPHVVVLSPGSKVGLVRALAKAVADARGKLTAWETDLLSPAACHCGDRVLGGSVERPEAVAALLDYCTKHTVVLIVPTRHDDLETLAHVAPQFAATGTSIAISSAACIRLCLDKAASHAWLAAQEFPIPSQWRAGDLKGSSLPSQFPVIAKHPRGSGSRSIRLCRNTSELEALPAEWLVQSVAPGAEYTVNVYVDRAGRSLCEIPHLRLLVNEGEVVRGRTERHPVLMALARRIAESLPGARGPLNIQIFWDAVTNQATVIEINPRFGGGYPLAHAAGGRFAEWLIRDFVESVDLPRCDDWTANLTMVRYREAAFFPDGR